MTTKPTTRPLFTRYQYSMGNQVHLSHLLPYLPQFHCLQELVEAIHATHALVRTHDYQSMGLGSPGPYELMVKGGTYYASLHLLWHGRPLGEWTLDSATSLLSFVGHNGCGPDSAEDLYADLLEIYAIAQHLQRPVGLQYASLSELIIQPSGMWHLVSAHSTSLRLLTNEDD